jgi:hypothetical protein
VHQDADPVLLDADLEIVGDQQPGRDIGTAVALIVLGDRKLAEQIDVLVDDLLNRTALDLQGPTPRGRRPEFAVSPERR